MGRKQDTFMKGMEAGARPFEEKFTKLSETTHQMGKEINSKLDGISGVIDILADDMSDMQKKELYHLNTPYDLKEDLDDDEKEIIVCSLLYLSKYAQNNEYQMKFLRSVINYTDMRTPSGDFNIACVENIESIKVQKIIMQTLMEYLYLETEDFSFLERLENAFGYFSVNRKGIQEIEANIETIYRATGKEGLAEKYGFVPKGETTVENAETESPEKRDEFPCYDGSDISEACADAVNIHHHYVVLKDSIVYCDKGTIYNVHKQTGRKTKITVETEHTEDILASNLCGYDNYIYIFCRDKLYRADLNIDITMKQIAKIRCKERWDAVWGDQTPDSHYPQCNDKYLIYRTSECNFQSFGSDNIICCIDLETMNERIIYNCRDLDSRIFKLSYNSVYIIDDRYWKYDLKAGTLKDFTDKSINIKDIAKLNYKIMENNIFRFQVDNDREPQSSQYGKFIISLVDVNGVIAGTKDENVYYVCFDLEKEYFDAEVVPSDEFRKKHAFVMYNYIYYVSTDSIVERYDILTKKSEKIIEAKNVVEYFKEGVFKKKLASSIINSRVTFQVVGNWLYYLDKLKIVHKVNITERREEIF